MQIDDQLRADCHLLGTLERASVLLNRNAAVGWLILVVDTDAIDWHLLDDVAHGRASAQIRALSGFVARWFDADKLNVATLGNQVRQMHVHLIARRFDDPCWPRPVWGNLEPGGTYSRAALEALCVALARELGVVPVSDAVD